MALAMVQESGLPLSGGTLSSSAIIGWSGRSEISSPADGNILLTNDAGTDFGRISLGGTTSSYPALKRSGAQIHAQLADDSANCPIQASLFFSAYSASGIPGFRATSGGGFGWTANSGAQNTVDTSLRRASAGVVGIGDGSAAGNGALQLGELGAAPTGVANSVIIYAEDNGAGKTRLMAIFGSGAAQQIAIEP